MPPVSKSTTMTSKAWENEGSGRNQRRRIEPAELKATCDRYGHVINVQREREYFPLTKPVSGKQITAVREALKMLR